MSDIYTTEKQVNLIAKLEHKLKVAKDGKPLSPEAFVKFTEKLKEQYKGVTKAAASARIEVLLAADAEAGVKNASGARATERQQAALQQLKAFSWQDMSMSEATARITIAQALQEFALRTPKANMSDAEYQEFVADQMEAFERLTAHLKKYVELSDADFTEYNDRRLGKVQDVSLSALIRNRISVARPSDLPDSEIPF